MAERTAGTIVATFLRGRTQNLTHHTEDELQQALAEILGRPAAREVQLSDGRSRIDLTYPYDDLDNITLIGIEVKTNGSLPNVILQLDRYAACPELHELILVTTKAQHHRIPTVIGARRIPLHLVTLIQNGL